MNITVKAAQIKERAYQARISVNSLMKRAGVSNSTLWRWENGLTDAGQPWTVGKIEDALDQIERERAA